MASSQLQTIIDMLTQRPPRREVNVEESRAAIEAGGALFGPEEGTVTEVADANRVPGEWITGPGATDAATLFYLHGGGYSIGSINSHRGLISRLSKASGGRAFAIDYRLAPENPYPAGLEDALTAYRWLLGQGVDPNALVIGGDSAGGGLVLKALIALRDSGDPLPAAAVLLSPWTDMDASGDSMKTRAAVDPMITPDPVKRMARLYAGDIALNDPRVSPLNADLTGLPPMLVHVGDHEVLLDDSTRLAERAEAAGVDVTLEVWPEMIHVWQFFAPLLPEATQAIERIGEFIRSRVATGVVA
jgi:epsilon-lactone hydrolase